MTTTEGTRAVHIDIVRGVAVFGLIWSNLNAGFYTGPVSTADTVARWASAVFSAGKFFTLFSLLFGVTLAIQLQRAEQAGRPFVARWLRRMAVLFVIGWAHAILFWPGDILREYAIAGIVLLLFRTASTRTIVVATVLMLALGSSRQSLSVFATRVTGGDVAAVVKREQADPAQLARRQALGRATNNGTYTELLRARAAQQMGEWKQRASAPAGPLNWITWWYVANFLIGLMLGRTEIVQRPGDHAVAVKRLMVLGLVVGLPLNVYLATRPAWLANHWANWPLMIGARLTLGLGYLGGLLWLLQRAAWLQRLRVFAPVGRLGLTNYIAQTAFLTFVTFHYGLGLAPRLGWFACFVIAALFYAVQVVWSNVWVRSFRFGPIEWVWRSLTLLRPVPMRVATADVTEPSTMPMRIS
jgi:uncharacterized protein